MVIFFFENKNKDNFFILEAEKYPNLSIEFNHKVKKCNTNTGEIIFEKYLNKF